MSGEYSSETEQKAVLVKDDQARIVHKYPTEEFARLAREIIDRRIEALRMLGPE